MEDLGYPKNIGELIGNLYINSTTSFHGNHFGAIPLILINIGTIQGDTINPYLFIIFLDPLLRWLGKNNIGYHFKTSTTTCDTLTYVDNLAIITDNLVNKQPQIHKLQKFSEWSHLDLKLTKCAITKSPNKSKLEPHVLKVYIQAQKILLNNKPSPHYPKMKLMHT